MTLLLAVILLPPVVPFSTGHFWLFLATCLLMATVIGWPIASLIAAMLLAVGEGNKPVTWR